MSESTSSPLLGPLQTKLPPSPEIRAGSAGPLPEFSLDGKAVSRTFRRLRSVARYQSFYPQALACSNVLSAYDDRGHPSQNVDSSTDDSAMSCLGAVAGPQGVALFRLSRPHTPLLILSHATKATTPHSSLAFEPKDTTTSSSSNSLLLASTRGTGMLIWDASGHSPNPLIGRFGMDQVTNGTGSGGMVVDFDSSSITSMSWKPKSPTPMLATTTASTLCVWDLRNPNLATTKFHTAPHKSAPSPFVQVACAEDSYEVATLDTAGIVQVFDVRMNAPKGRAALTSFAAHETGGIGISSFGKSRWLTWGLDAPMSSAVIKIWSHPQEDSRSEMTPRAGMDELPPRPTPPMPQSEYALTAQCVRPNTACARVCLSPVENSFMAIGHAVNAERTIDGWWAELYSLDEDAEMTARLGESLSIRTFGIEKKASFKGGAASHENDKIALTSVLGSRTKLGNLQAAELSFASASRDSEASELLLCCLSDSGVVSTHGIPEAIPKSLGSAVAGVKKMSSTKSALFQSNVVRTAFTANNQAKVFPEDGEGTSLTDAANYWGFSKPGALEASSILGRIAGDRHLLTEPTTSSPQKAEQTPSGMSSRRSDNALMPFDMEVPVAYGSVTAGSNLSSMQIGMTDMSTGAIVSTTSMGRVIEEGDRVSTDPIPKSTMVETIEAERIPCPRLCGAVFGRGNGGLIIFHNGEVRKMWNWFQRTDSAKQPNTLSVGESGPNALEHEGLRRVHNATGSGSTQPLATGDLGGVKPAVVAKVVPRTLKELMSMVAAAKETQWGEEVTSDGSASDDILSASDNLFEDESIDSNSSDDDDDDEDAMVIPAKRDDMYNRYFGSGGALQGNVIDTTELEIKSPSSSSRAPASPHSPIRLKKIQPFLGPSSEMLTPVVFLSRRLDKEILGHQSIQLAKGYKLGPWGRKFETIREEKNYLTNLEETKVEKMDVLGDFIGHKGLPHYRQLLISHEASDDDFPNLVRTKSEGNLERKYKKKYEATGTISSRTGDQLRRFMKESGSTGEGAVRPSMEESMKFFKKLFVQPQKDGSSGFSSMLSPPDRPRDHFFGGKLTKGSRNISAGNLQNYREDKLASVGRSELEANPTVKLGVYSLRVSKLKADDANKKILDEIKIICQHNAEFCSQVGEVEREGVWKLLAQTVDRQIDEVGTQSFSGWGGNGGGALGVELVGNLLKYYEAQGDCQMLATMVCVLSGGRRGHSSRDESRPYLLPLGNDEKYDLYIRRYADLLYDWGLLTLRAELNKHLLRVPTDHVDTSLVKSSKLGIVEEVSKNLGSRVSGLAVVFQCPRCGNDTEFDTNVCRTCQDFALRCSLCDNAVKGLFTVCDICGHGGHVDHMTSWFTTHDECPTGCGCICRPFGSTAIEAAATNAANLVGALP